MICLSEEESEKFKQHQVQYDKLMKDCNQSAIEALRSNPYVDINQVKVIEEYNRVIAANKKEHNNLVVKYNQLSDQNTGLTFVITILLMFLGVTYFIIFIYFIKWLIKVERKMSKRDEPKPIKFPPRTNPKKGDRH